MAPTPRRRHTPPSVPSQPGIRALLGSRTRWRIPPRRAAGFNRLAKPSDSSSRRATTSGRHQHGLGRRYRYRPRRRLRAQPSRRKPATRYGELAPAAIQANANVRRRGYGWMAQRARPITIEPNFSRNGGESFRAALWTGHVSTSARKLFGCGRSLGWPQCSAIKLSNQQENSKVTSPNVTLVMGAVLLFAQAQTARVVVPSAEGIMSGLAHSSFAAANDEWGTVPDSRSGSPAESGEGRYFVTVNVPLTKANL